ncbi:hypothetical protein [Sulfolobus spindle-shaped virus]|nr:hypothetical protein [Sulfolobus spindle-shaped virus]AZG04130.1 hypothetical protein [Sulfolobus spindle-shaped virus]
MHPLLLGVPGVKVPYGVPMYPHGCRGQPGTLDSRRQQFPINREVYILCM